MVSERNPVMADIRKTYADEHQINTLSGFFCEMSVYMRDYLQEQGYISYSPYHGPDRRKRPLSPTSLFPSSNTDPELKVIARDITIYTHLKMNASSLERLHRRIG